MAVTSLGPGGYTGSRDGVYGTTYTKTINVPFQPYIYVNTENGQLQRSRMQYIPIVDGSDAPSALTGYGFLYIDASSGELTVMYSTGTTRTVASGPG